MTDDNLPPMWNKSSLHLVLESQGMWAFAYGHGKDVGVLWDE